METILKKSIVSVGIFFSTVVSAQKTTILDYFNINDLNGNVLLNWQISQGSTCNGINVLRSVNQSEFVEVGHISGVCGATNEPIGYQFIDENPVNNQVNSYRLDLGGYGYSEVVTINIVVEPRIDLQFFPNPITSQSKLYFKNKDNKPHFLFIYNSSGILTNSLNTTFDFFEVYSSSFQKGIYFFSLISLNNEIITKGKFIIQ